MLQSPPTLSADGHAVRANAPAQSVAIDLTEFKSGWRILLLATLGVGVNANSSMLYAFGAFVLPLQNAFNWNRGDLQSAVSFLFAGAVLGSQLVGWLNLRFGARRVTCISLISLSLTFAAMTQMRSSIIWLYAFFTLLPIASMGTMQVTWTHVVLHWFERNRGLALALMLSGTGLAAALIPSLVTWAISRWNWQAAFLALAALPLLLVLPLTWRWMQEPAHGSDAHSVAPVTTAPAAGMPFGVALRAGKFWCLNIALSLIVAAVVTMVTTTVPLLQDKGLSAAAASRIFGGFGVSLIFGRLLVGYLVDRLWAPGVACIALSAPALGCLLLWLSSGTDTTALAAATLLIGIGAGAEFDLAAFLVARYFGMRDYGRLFGVHLGLITLASALAPWLFGALYKSTGSYSPMLALCAAIFVGGATMLLALGRYPRFDESR
jgi:MFS family permease